MSEPDAQTRLDQAGLQAVVERGTWRTASTLETWQVRTAGALGGQIIATGATPDEAVAHAIWRRSSRALLVEAAP